MNDLDFIADVIYGLKLEYGKTLTFKDETRQIDALTGAVTSTPQADIIVPLAIPLPINMRAAFLKAVGINRMGYLEPGEREILIDNTDLAGADPQSLLHRYIITGSKKEEITKVEDYEFGSILIAKS